MLSQTAGRGKKRKVQSSLRNLIERTAKKPVVSGKGKDHVHPRSVPTDTVAQCGSASDVGVHANEAPTATTTIKGSVLTTQETSSPMSGIQNAMPGVFGTDDTKTP